MSIFNLDHISAMNQDMTVLVADDHTVVREGLKKIIGSIPSVKVIEEVSNGLEALSLIRDKEYDLVVLDISMPGLSGLDILLQLKNLGLNKRILILSYHSEEQYALRAIALGASGYINKGAGFEEIKKAIMKILEGGNYISASLAEKVIFKPDQLVQNEKHELLSQREFQVMCLLAKGYTNHQISEMVFISGKTISTYRSRIMAKMGMHSNAELTRYALEHHLID